MYYHDAHFMTFTRYSDQVPLSVAFVIVQHGRICEVRHVQLESVVRPRTKLERAALDVEWVIGYVYGTSTVYDDRHRPGDVSCGVDDDRGITQEFRRRPVCVYAAIVV